MLLGTGVTLLASLPGTPGDSRAADRRRPRGRGAADREAAEQSHNAGVVVTTVSLAAILLGAFGGLAPDSSGCCSAPACSALFAGIALLAPRLVEPLVRVVGWPARRRRRRPGELATANAVRNPGRTASTAATLMIGLTLVTVVAVLGAGMTRHAERR